MKWKPFEESRLELPEIIIEQMVEGFSVATSDLAHITIQAKSDVARVSSDNLGTRFQFNVTLLSSHLSDYSFKVFELGYNVTLYPVKIYVVKSILEELVKKGEQVSQLITLEDDEKLRNFVQVIFETKRFTETVVGLMKIARNRSQSF